MDWHVTRVSSEEMSITRVSSGSIFLHGDHGSEIKDSSEKSYKFEIFALCEVSVVANGGYYSPCSDNAKKLEWNSGRESVCWAVCSVQQKCYRRIEKYKATLKELTTLKDCFPKIYCGLRKKDQRP